MGSRTKGKDNQKNIDRALKEFGFDENLLEQMTHQWMDRYFIEGEICTELEEILRRAPENLLNTILEAWGQELPVKMIRSEKEEMVSSVILGSFQENFIYLDKKDLEVLLKTANNNPLNVADALALVNDYCMKGWAFMFGQKREMDFVIPSAIRDMLLANLENEKIKAVLGLVVAVRKTMRACLNLYGVVEKEKVIEILLDKMLEFSSVPETDELEWVPEATKEILQTICEREEGGYWCDECWIISDDFENRGQYKRFLRKVADKQYYLPTREEINLYADALINIEDLQYKKVHKYLTRLIRDVQRADDLMYEIEYKVVEENLNDAGIMKLLFERYVGFSNKANAEGFAKLCSDWIYDVRKWENRGFTDREKGRAKVISQAYVAENAGDMNVKSVKIGRNDPCPCGSGKKYKKCCGR